MDELESLTDNELRIRLLQYGFQNIPITQTTRKTLIKKLRLYLQNAGSSLKKSKDLVTKYSSDEDSHSSPIERKKLSIKPSYPIHHQASKKSYSNSKNIYVSPVIINDDTDEDDHSYGSKSVNSSRNSFTFGGNSTNNELDSTSSCTKRLLQLRRDNIQKAQLSRKEATRNENGRSFETKSTPSKLFTMPEFKKRDTNNAYAQRYSLVSILLMVFPIIFFALLIFAYLAMSSNIENTIHPSRASFTTCENAQEQNVDCIEDSRIESSLKFLKVIAGKLRETRVSSCGDQTRDQYMICKNDLKKLMSNSEDDAAVLKDFHNIKYLIDHNPAWGIVHINVNGEECFTLSTPASLVCTIFRKIQKFFTIIGSLAVLGIVYLASRKLYHYTLAMKEKRREQARKIVDEIFSMLMEDRENPYLTVDYMRDRILSEKKFIASEWNTAIAHLEKNEKSLAFGFENVNGEDLKVVRLIDKTEQLNKPTRSTSFQKNEGNVKKWIGPAFEKSNKITPPTNCLKIRQMFDKYEVNNEDLQTCIQETILSKVRHRGCKIVDIQLDRKTCCVYVKCATFADAGIIHSEINGWWLDGQLVVVKFLKEEKYDQRFPSTNNGSINAKLSPSKFFSNSYDERDSDF